MKDKKKGLKNKKQTELSEKLPRTKANAKRLPHKIINKSGKSTLLNKQKCRAKNNLQSAIDILK